MTVTVRLPVKYVEDLTSSNILEWCCEVLGELYRALIAISHIKKPTVELCKDGFVIVESDVENSRWFPIRCRIGRKYVTFMLEVELDKQHE